ncbi:penicillin-binding protein 2D [Arthrobacter sp. Hiyo8]|nr:penicillin-binding protein 2D [Arthrobacter sp. Hiyo8]
MPDQHDPSPENLRKICSIGYEFGLAPWTRRAPRRYGSNPARTPVPAGVASGRNGLLDTGTTLGRILIFLGVSAVCGMLVAGLLVPAAAVAGITANGSAQFFNGLPSVLTVAPAGQVTRVLAADGSQIATLFNENRTQVPLEQMSPNIKNAIVAIEDSRFYEHGASTRQGSCAPS